MIKKSQNEKHFFFLFHEFEEWKIITKTKDESAKLILLLLDSNVGNSNSS